MQVATERAPRADALVVFGASGDLAKKKLLPSLYRLERRGRLCSSVVGVGRTQWDASEFGEYVTESVRASEDEVDATVLDRLCSRLDFVEGDYRDVGLYRRIVASLGGSVSPLSYLAIPPFLFEEVIEGLGAVGLNRGSARVVLEKPFGRDRASAKTLNDILLRAFPEERVFRIDHFLGKEPIQNLLTFRFANALWEPVWNRNHVDAVQVSMLEDFDVEGRGGFYDDVGALRDVVQNHLLEIVTLLAMEPPVAATAEALRDEKVKVLTSMRAVDIATMVRGQYEGYRTEADVAVDSNTETYVELTVEIDNWRWAGVPFRLRAGKALSTTVTEAVVEFRRPPMNLFHTADRSRPERNHLRFRMKPDDAISLRVQTKLPASVDEVASVDLSVSSHAMLGDAPEAYEQLLDDAMSGDARRFARADAVDHQWRVVEPLLDPHEPPLLYRRGSSGPRVERPFRWLDP